MKPINFPIRSVGNSGFSLIEMAMVLMIMGILLSGVMVAVSQTTENARRAAALSQLRQIEDALYGFAQSAGRLPCPAIADNSGVEQPPGGGDVGACTRVHGFIPVTTIGFSGSVNADGLLVDPWQNPIRYSVVHTPSPDTNPNFTMKAGADSIKTFFSNSDALMVYAGSSFLQVCPDTPCGSQTLSSIVPAVIMSMGEDWANTTSDEEQANAGDESVTGTVTGTVYPLKADSDRDFVSTDYAEDQFDDQLVWLSPYVLFNKMVSAGKLP